MKTEQQIKDAIISIQIDDSLCPTEAHVKGLPCLDVGHAIRGTWKSVLWWVLELGEAPWSHHESTKGG